MILFYPYYIKQLCGLQGTHVRFRTQIWQRWKADSGRLTADGMKGADKVTRTAVSGGRTEMSGVQES